jgi:hypothetical protein
MNRKGATAADIDADNLLIFAFFLSIGRVGTNLFIIALKGSKIFTCLREFTLQ